MHRLPFPGEPRRLPRALAEGGRVKPARAALAGLLLATPLSAQGYRLRLDARFQAVSFRGVQLDSVLATDSTSGFAVHCSPGDVYCTYFRPGARLTAAPFVTTADFSGWGFGLRGVSVHATARVGLDAGDAEVWPGTRPAGQLLVGYVEYAAERLTARAGRQVSSSRLGWTGFDGASLTLRAPHRGGGLDFTGYAGWGLARGTALPVTSPALNPLDDFQPRRRQLVAGVEAGWTGAASDARVIYQREVDPGARAFVSERVALSAAARPVPGWTVSGGADYDMAAGWWGSADLSLAYTTRAITASVEARRYRSHFDLWTIWGAFSPVPYTSAKASFSARAFRQLRLHARGERYRFDAAGAETPLVSYERDGSRMELGATLDPASGWILDAGYTRDFGPGAASVGTGASVTYAPARNYRVTLHGSSLDRPLEFRFSESVLKVIGVDGSVDVSERVRLSIAATRYAERRRRPDAAAFDWNQWRLNAGLVLLLARGADLGNLPPAIRRMPGGRSER